MAAPYSSHFSLKLNLPSRLSINQGYLVSFNPTVVVAMQATLYWAKALLLYSLLSYHEIEFMVFARYYWLRMNWHLVLQTATSFCYFFYIPLSLRPSLLHFRLCLSAPALTVSGVNNPRAPWLKD